jgi:hypothetical protein
MFKILHNSEELTKGKLVTTGNGFGIIESPTKVKWWDGNKFKIEKLGEHFEINGKVDDYEIWGGVILEEEIPDGCLNCGNYSLASESSHDFKFENGIDEISISKDITNNVVYNGKINSIKFIKDNKIELVLLTEGEEKFKELPLVRVFSSESEAGLYLKAKKKYPKSRFKTGDYATIKQGLEDSPYLSLIHSEISSGKPSTFVVGEHNPEIPFIRFKEDRVLPEELFDLMTAKEYEDYQRKLRIFDNIKSSIVREMDNKDNSIIKLQASIVARLREKTKLFERYEKIKIEDVYDLLNKSLSELKKHSAVNRVEFTDSILTVDTNDLFLRTCTHKSMPKKKLPLNIGTWRINIDIINAIVNASSIKPPSYLKGRHPHIGSSSVCLGNVGMEISQSLARFDFMNVVDLIIAVLEDVNDGAYGGQTIGTFIDISKI